MGLSPVVDDLLDKCSERFGLFLIRLRQPSVHLRRPVSGEGNALRVELLKCEMESCHTVSPLGLIDVGSADQLAPVDELRPVAPSAVEDATQEREISKEGGVVEPLWNGLGDLSMIP
jgi:hypothetical protein